MSADQSETWGGPSAELLELQGVGFASYMCRDADPDVVNGLMERIRQATDFGDLAPADQRLLTLWVRDFQHGHCNYGPAAWAGLDYGAEDEAAERLGLADGEPVPFSEIPYAPPVPPAADAGDAGDDSGLSSADFGPWVGL